MQRARRSWRRAACMVAVVTVALGLLTTGCTVARPSSTSAWQSTTDRTLGAVVSGLGTARIMVQQESRNHVPHTYAVVATTDVIESSGKEIAGYLVGQPPDHLHAANAAVAAALHDAADLLVEVRVAIASPGIDRATASSLLDRIDTMRDRLDRLDSEVEKSPKSAGRR